jgi:hypothetical protein
MRLALAPLVLLLVAGCVTAPAIGSGVRLRPETRPECAANCEELGMRLGAVVLIQNSAGCVCQPREELAPRSAPRADLEGGAGAIAGGALVIALEQARQQNASQSTVHDAGAHR